MKRLKYIFGIFCLLLCKQGFTQLKNGVVEGSFYIVRHAEKDTGNNPALKQIGYLRAGDLYRELKDKGISKIYVSQYRRTELTADSLRIYNKIETVQYKAYQEEDGIWSKITADPIKDQVVLIVGHTNNIPDIIRKLGVNDFNVIELPDNEYDNLYLVMVKGNRATLKQMKFGKPSPVAAKTMMKPLQ